jgi:hypothetical protein
MISIVELRPRHPYVTVAALEPAATEIFENRQGG